jgi:hypothetical protein
LIGRIQFTFRNRPVLAVAVSVVSLLVVATAITFTTPLRCGPAKALGLKNIASGCIAVAAVGTPGPVAIIPGPTQPPGKGNPYPPNGNPASGPYGYPASGPYPPYGNPASGPYPPYANQPSPGGPYPAFYPPASNGSVVTPMPLDCRLPVYAGPPGSGGFIVFPGGSFIPDQSSSVTVPATSPTPPPVGGPGPGYYGQGYGLTYDRQLSKWVPVGVTQVSPDGSRYAYTATDGIYVVNVANSTQSELGEGHSWSIVAVQTDGVYAGDPQAGGLWMLPFSGTPRQITKTGYWRVASKTAAYGTATSAVPQGASNIIQRLDLATGSAIDWFARPGTQSNVTGLDGKGNPIINVQYLNNSGSEIWIATTATSASAIAGFSPQYGGGFNSYNTPVADSHGIWFAGNYNNQYGGGNANGVALYVAGSGFYWMSGYGAQLAGGCY